jgi:hypothetical protein
MEPIEENFIISTPTTNEPGSFYVNFTTEDKRASEIALMY